jgi:hypothetical protein
MNRFVRSLLFSFPVLALAGGTLMTGSTSQGFAQDTKQKTLLPFKGSATGTITASLVPALPPFLSVSLKGAGEANLVGSFTGIGNLKAHLGLDGNPIDGTDGTGVLQAANGDAIYIEFTGLTRPAANPGPGAAGYEAAISVLGGTGKFASATGNGSVIVQAQLLKGEFTATIDAVIAVPKS